MIEVVGNQESVVPQFQARDRGLKNTSGGLGKKKTDCPRDLARWGSLTGPA